MYIYHLITFLFLSWKNYVTEEEEEEEEEEKHQEEV